MDDMIILKCICEYFSIYNGLPVGLNRIFNYKNII